MEDLPEGLFRNAIDLNRFSNGTSKKLINSYNRIILKAIKELKRIEAMPSAQRPKVRAARLRALLAQTKASLNTWSVKSVNELAKDLEGIAQIQSDFATQQISKALSPSAKQFLSVNSVEVTPSFAKAVVNADPLSVSTNILSRSMEEVVKGPSPSFKLTATQGSQIRMPGGTSIAKTFRGLAERNAEHFATVVQDGLLTGETTQQLARRLVGNLDFGDIGPLSVKQLAQSGGELTKLANHQVMTLTRTSINQVANTASQQVYRANSDLTSKYRYVATLDSRTSPICRELDGKEFIYGKGPEPAQHFNCRSTTVAVIDYDKIQEKHPNVKPPSKPLGKRAAAGGSVPSDTTYGKWLHGQRAKTKSGKMSKFEPGPMQIKTLGKEKAKYFNRLADKYGADEAMKKFLRDDGSEVSLATLHKRYGDPSKIVKAKPKVKVKSKVKPKPIAKAKPKTELFDKRLVDSDPNDLVKMGQQLLDEVGGLDYSVVSSLHRRFQLVRKADPTRFKKAMDIYIRGADKFEKKMEKVKQLMMKTNLSDIQVKQFVKEVNITTSFKASEKKQLKGYLDEYVRMFNGNGFVKSRNGVPAISKIGKAQRGSCKFHEGSLTTSVGSLGSVSKGVTFHEISHAVEVANPNINKWTTTWRNKKGFTDRKKILERLANKNAQSVYGPSQQAGKPVYRLKDITKINYKNVEDALVNDYLDPYMGKVYMKYNFSRFGIEAVDPTEVLSMGVEHFDSASHMTKLFRQHPDLFKMIVGMSRASGL